jgi:hypothetical protein
MKDIQYHLNAWAQAGMRDSFNVTQRKPGHIAPGKAATPINRIRGISNRSGKQLTLFEP